MVVIGNPPHPKMSERSDVILMARSLFSSTPRSLSSLTGIEQTWAKMGAAGSKPADAATAPNAAEAKSANAQPIQVSRFQKFGALGHLLTIHPSQLGRSLLNQIDKTQTEVAAEEQPSLLSATRQSQLDASIQSRIKSELSRLKKQESDVRKQIELALEKENLDKESKLGKKGAQGRSSVLLKQQLDEISTKIDKHNQTREKLEKTPAIQKAREEVTKCYKCVCSRASVI